MISYEEGMEIIKAYGEGPLGEIEADAEGGVSAAELGRSLNVDGELVEHIVTRMTASVPLVVGMKGMTLPDAVQHAVGAAMAMGILLGKAMVPDTAMPDLDNVLTDEPDGTDVKPVEDNDNTEGEEK